MPAWLSQVLLSKWANRRLSFGRYFREIFSYQLDRGYRHALFTH